MPRYTVTLQLPDRVASTPSKRYKGRESVSITIPDSLSQRGTRMARKVRCSAGGFYASLHVVVFTSACILCHQFCYYISLHIVSSVDTFMYLSVQVAIMSFTNNMGKSKATTFKGRPCIVHPHVSLMCLIACHYALVCARLSALYACLSFAFCTHVFCRESSANFGICQ